MRSNVLAAKNLVTGTTAILVSASWPVYLDRNASGRELLRLVFKAAGSTQQFILSHNPYYVRFYFLLIEIHLFVEIFEVMSPFMAPEALTHTCNKITRRLEPGRCKTIS